MGDTYRRNDQKYNFSIQQINKSQKTLLVYFNRKGKILCL